jgi:ribosomal protein L16/L10AE
MLQPKRTKFRKAHKGRIKGAASSAVTLNFGNFGRRRSLRASPRGRSRLLGAP